MALELIDPKTGKTKPAFPGATGFLVLAKLRGSRNVCNQAMKQLRTFATEYTKDRFPNAVVEESGDKAPEEKKEGEKEEDNVQSTESTPESGIVFGPHELVYDNCCFISSNVEDPSDYAHFAFNKMADDKNWPQPRFPLRIMPVQAICFLTPKYVEEAVRPLLEPVLAGDEAIRFSINLHGKLYQDSKDMSRVHVEAVVRNLIWAINPNCVQCIKYQDYAILLEILDPLLFVGIAKDFNQLGRYNTATIHMNGRDLQETMEDSEDDISDDLELSEFDNVERKLRIKKKRRAEKYGAVDKIKQGKFEGEEENAEDEVDKNDELAKDENNEEADATA